MSSINLLDSRNKVVTPTNLKRQKFLRRSAIAILFLTGGFSVTFFMLIALSPLPQLEKQHKAASVNLSLLNKDVAMLSLAKDRTDTINSIIKQRITYDKILEDFSSELPAGVSIDSISMKEKKLSVTLSSKSLLQLHKFLDQLANDATAKSYSVVTLTGLKTQPDKNDFNLSLDITML